MMTIKYHINPETGRPNQCSADENHKNGRGCKYTSRGGIAPEHYPSKEEARKAYEAKMADDTIPTQVKKKKEKTPELVIEKATPQEILEKNEIKIDEIKINELLDDFEESVRNNTPMRSNLPKYKTTSQTKISSSIEEDRENGKVFFKNGDSYPLVARSDKDKKKFAEGMLSFRDYNPANPPSLSIKDQIYADLSPVLNDRGQRALNIFLSSKNSMPDTQGALGEEYLNLYNDVLNDYASGVTSNVKKSLKATKLNSNEKRAINSRAEDRAKKDFLASDRKQELLNDFLTEKKSYEAIECDYTTLYDKAYFKVLKKLTKKNK